MQVINNSVYCILYGQEGKYVKCTYAESYLGPTSIVVYLRLRPYFFSKDIIKTGSNLSKSYFLFMQVINNSIS